MYVQSSESNGMGTEDGIICVNVGGVKHETLLATLQRYPTTLLASLQPSSKFYRADRNEYFFDRHPGIFSAILNYYRTGELHCPLDICGSLFSKELVFWGINEEEIRQCCWVKYKDDLSQKEFLDIFEGSWEKEKRKAEAEEDQGCTKCLRSAWMCLEYPSSSVLAMVFSVVTCLMTIASIILFCVETMPGVRGKMTARDYAEYYRITVEEYNNAQLVAALQNMTSKYPELDHVSVPNTILDNIDMTLMAFFVLELVIRFIVCPRKLRFFCYPASIFDTLSVIPLFIELIVTAVDHKEVYEQTYVDALYVFKIFRIFRMFRMIQHTKGYLVFIHTFRASWKDLLLMLVCLLGSIVLFGSLIFIFNKNQVFTSIPKSFWWAIVTATTVGYGDMVPSTPMGYFVGILCTLSGVFLIAFTVPSVVNNFLMFYSHVQYPRVMTSRPKSITPINKGGNTQSNISL